MFHGSNEDEFTVEKREETNRLVWYFNTTPTTAKFPGHDFGGKMTAFAGGFDDGPCIIKVAGHNGWSARGQTSYYPPMYLIGIITGIDDKGRNGTFHLKHQITYTRKHMRTAKIKADELYRKLKG